MRPHLLRLRLRALRCVRSRVHKSGSPDGVMGLKGAAGAAVGI